MHCPRCGVPNDDARAACWNCFAQLSAPVGGKIDKKAAAKAPKPPKPEKPAKVKKGKKGEAVVDTAPEPIVVPEPIAPVAAAVVDSAPIELDAVPTEVVAAPLDIPTITASAEPATPDFSSAPAFGDFSSEPESTVVEEDNSFIAGIPMGDDTDASPNNARVMDLDAPIDDSSYIIPGLADESPDKPLGEDVDAMDDLGPMAFDLDSEEPGKKPEGPNKQ
jgi:hypothetical protein